MLLRSSPPLTNTSLLRSDPITERSSDDGEPQGTAGAPILAALRGEDLTDTMCVVVRYSGGIKLGAGGLIRAYGGAARDALAEAEKLKMVPKRTVVCSVPSSSVGDVYSLCASYEDAVVLGEEFGGHEVRICEGGERGAKRRSAANIAPSQLAAE